MSQSNWAKGKRVCCLALLGGLFAGCADNPTIPFLPGQPWSFVTETTKDLYAATQYRPPGHGGSLTLYAGTRSDPELRESAILVRFVPLTDAEMTDLRTAQLVLFRRAFGDPADTLAAFDIYTVEEAADSVWTESDSGLTLNDFPQINFVSTVQMVMDSILVFSADTMINVPVEHLIIPLDTLLLQRWASEELINNGLLIRSSGGDSLWAFHSREAEREPYVWVEYNGKTAADADTIVSRYNRIVADLSIYPPPAQADTSGQDYFQVNHSQGLMGSINFSSALDSAEARPVAGARLVLHRHGPSTRLSGAQMSLALLWRTEALEDGNGARLIQDNIIFPADADSLIITVSTAVKNYLNNVDSFGMVLLVKPQHHDFDQFGFWGPGAADDLKPRLDIIYSSPYVLVEE